MFETSRDILNLAIALSVVALAGFGAWAVYYMARILQQVFKITKEMRDRIAKVDELIKLLKEKIEHSTSYLLLIGEGVKKLVEIGRKYTEKKDN
jgi:CHASE3 domain sensor protein